MTEKKYLEPFNEVAEILSKVKGINYIISVVDSTDDPTKPCFVGGCGWSVEDAASGPDFFTMVGGLMEQFMVDNEMPYAKKLSVLRNFNKILIENITNMEDKSYAENQ